MSASRKHGEDTCRQRRRPGSNERGELSRLLGYVYPRARMTDVWFVCDHHDKMLRMHIDDISGRQVAQLRRAIMIHTPTFAIDKVEIHENTSELCDMFIVQRLSLVTMDCSTVDLSSATSAHESIGFRLSVENTSSEGHLDVRSSHMVPETPHGVRPLHGGIILAKLMPGQAVDMSLKVRRGTGESHPKWSANSGSTFQPRPRITVNAGMWNEMDEVGRLDLIRCCPRGVLQTSAERGDLDVARTRGGRRRRSVGARATEGCSAPATFDIEDHHDACTFCGQCENHARSARRPALISVRPTENRYTFTVRTNGAYDAVRALALALEHMRHTTVPAPT